MLSPNLVVQVKMGRTAIHVFTPYSPELNAVIKTCSTYDWNKEKKRWEFPLDPVAVDDMLTKMRASGVTVQVDPKIDTWNQRAMEMTRRVLATLQDKDPELMVPTRSLQQGFDLFRFQKVGINFAATAGRAIIGDEMGLGKTVQLIKIVEEMEKRGKIKGDGPYLLVVPNSKTHDWAEEIRLWYGDRLPIHVIDKRPKSERCLDEPVLRGWYIINIEKVSRREKILTSFKWDMVGIDESHRIKNRDSKTTKVMFKLAKIAKHRYALTGTSIVNDIPDLWAQLHFVNPTRFTSYWKFVNRYMNSEDDIFGRSTLTDQNMETAEELTQVLRTNMIARLETDPDVDVDLPPIRHKKIVVELGKRQRKVYEQMLNDYVAWIDDVPQNDDGDIIAPNPMTQLGRLKQIAGSLEIFGVPEITDSAKIDTLIELVQDNPTEKFVILSQYKTIVNVVAKRLREAKVPHGRMDGDHQHHWRVGDEDEGHKHENRHALIKEFQRDPMEDINAGQSMLRCFVATMQTGGESVTLTAATKLVFLDLMWTTKDVRQAFKRIHRIGQNRSCMIYYILARNTVDFSAILPTLRRKQAIIDAVLNPKPPEEFEPPIAVDRTAA